MFMFSCWIWRVSPSSLPGSTGLPLGCPKADDKQHGPRPQRIQGPKIFSPKNKTWKCVMLHHPVSCKSNRPRRGTEEWPDGRGALGKKHIGTHVVPHFGAPRKEGVRWCILMQRKNCFLGGKGHLWFLLCWESTITFQHARCNWLQQHALECKRWIPFPGFIKNFYLTLRLQKQLFHFRNMLLWHRKLIFFSENELRTVFQRISKKNLATTEAPSMKVSTRRCMGNVWWTIWATERKKVKD